MTVYAQHVSTKKTPQSEAIPGSSQVENSAGGFSFQVDDWTRLDRFLVLGAEGGSYYATERALTKDNAQAVQRCIDDDGARAVSRIVEISESGRAPKNDPAIFALALAAAAGAEGTRQLALQAMPRVCRIGTHLFQFNENVKALRGRGRAFGRAMRHWYTDKAVSEVARQVTKYQQRNGWSHRDILRLCKPKVQGGLNDVFHWITKGWDGVGEQPHDNPDLLPIWAFERAKKADKTELCRLIREYQLPRECVPTEMLNHAEVWEALLEKMPMTAMIRNLATMTRVGLLAPMSSAVRKVCAELVDDMRLKKSRIHPVAVLAALLTYKSGRGVRGQNTWNPVSQVVDALDASFYRCLVPETRILAANLRWMSLEEVKIGDEVVSVDEFPPGGKGPSRKMRKAVVEGKWESKAPVFEVTVEDGRVLFATDKHRFLMRKRWQTGTEWREVAKMRVGDSIKWITKPWGVGDYEDGWFGGFIDGEATFRTSHTGVKLVLHQTSGRVYDRAEEYLMSRGYTYSSRVMVPHVGGFQKKDVNHLILCRMNELFKLLGQTSPSRPDACWWNGKRMPGKGGGVGWSKITSIKPAGIRRVIDIQTSTGTFIAEGFVSHNSFGNVEPTGKRWLLALDVSGSMGSWEIAGVPGLSPRVGSAALALVTAAVEQQHHFVGFTSGGWSDGRRGRWGNNCLTNCLTPLAISPRQRLDDVCNYVAGLPMGGTDCALPMLYATATELAVDVFVVLTDSETWAGDIHPSQALREYRQRMGIPAKLIVCGMVANQFSIADPNDSGQLDVVGFDTNTPSLMSDFAK